MFHSKDIAIALQMQNKAIDSETKRSIRLMVLLHFSYPRKNLVGPVGLPVKLVEGCPFCAATEPQKGRQQMERQYRIGENVIYVDKFGIPRDALITIWWTGGREISEYLNDTGEPGCNLAFISGDPSRDDSCGRQTERETSVVHKTLQPAHGFYWCWEDELDDSQKAQLNMDRA